MKLNKQNIYEHLLNRMFIISKHKGITANNVEKKYGDNWYKKLTMTQKQFEKWEAESIEKIKKVFRVNTFRAKQEFGMLYLNHGLKIEN